MAQKIEQPGTHKQLTALLEVVSRASLGDFSGNVPVPDTGDDVAELAVGINLMLQVIREKIDELGKSNTSLEERVTERTRDLEAAKHETELRAKEVEATLRHMVGREMKMVELKNELKRLKEQQK